MPHWIVAYDVDDRHVFIHDPWLDTEQTESPINKAALAIPLKEFERISVYGKSRLRAAVVVEAPRKAEAPLKSPDTSLREAPRGRASRRPERPS